LFEASVKNDGLSPKLVATVLVQYPKRLKKKGLPLEILDEKTMADLLMAVKEGRIFKEGLLPLLEQRLATHKTVDELLLPKATEREFQESLLQIVEGTRAGTFTSAESRARRAMGLIMDKWRGRVDGTEAAQKLTLFLKDGAR